MRGHSLWPFTPPPIHLLRLLIHKLKHFDHTLCVSVSCTTARAASFVRQASLGFFHPLRLLSVLSSAASRTC